MQKIYLSRFSGFRILGLTLLCSAISIGGINAQTANKYEQKRNHVTHTTSTPNMSKVAMMGSPVQVKSLPGNILPGNPTPLSILNYCQPVLDCTDGDLILNVTFGSINNNSDCTANGYTDYSTSVPAVTVTKGDTYPISVTVGNGFSSESVSVWIDYDQNGVYDASEFTYIGTGSGQVVSGSITIPAGAINGSTGMRVRVAAVGSNLATADLACNDSQEYGESEDYEIIITGGVDCTNAATAVLSSSATAVCANSTITLSTDLVDIENGTRFLFEYSYDGTTWINTGSLPTSSTSSITVTQNTSYRVTTSCINGGTPIVSNIVQVTLNPITECYCEPVLGCDGGDNILNVTFGAINNDSDCGVDGYNDFTALAPAMLQTSLTYPISVAVGDGWLYETVSVWIDYNQNGIFDNDEYTFIGTGYDEILTGNITIPTTALAGVTRMRVRVVGEDDTAAGPDQACEEAVEFGETEDYLVNISLSSDCSSVPAITYSASKSSICAAEPVSFTISTNITEGGFTYQLQTSTDNGTTWVNNGNPQTSPAFNISNITESSIVRVVVVCTFGGTPVNSNIMNITVKPVLECYCKPTLDCGDDDNINKVEFVTINNPSTCDAGGYSDFTALAAADVRAGNSYEIKVTVGDGFASESVSVWIDYNKNGEFEASEFTAIGTGSGAAVTGTIAIPANATLGETRMRVRVAAVTAANATADLACDAEQAFGETEDYKINIIAHDLGMTSVISNSDLSVYPNPTSDEITVSTSKSHDKIELTIVDITGRVLEIKNIEANGLNAAYKVDLKKYVPGTYILNFKGQDSLINKTIIRK